jgi:hypothetical protein
MSHTLTHDTDDVFIWIFEGHIDSAGFHDWYVQTRQVTIESPLPTLYHIMDVLKAETDFGAILGQMREVGQDPFVAIDGRSINFLFVGSNEMAKLAANLAKLPQFGGFEMPMFRTLEDAHEYLRIDRAKQQGVTS